MYWSVKGGVIGNINYIANLVALKQWYVKVRPMFFGGSAMAGLYEGVLDKLDMAIRERIERFKALAEKMPESADRYRAIVKRETSDKLRVGIMRPFLRFRGSRPDHLKNTS